MICGYTCWEDEFSETTLSECPHANANHILQRLSGNKQLKRLRATRYLLNSKETRRKYVLFTSIVAYRNTNRSECDVHRGERTFDTVYSYSRSLSLSGL